MHICCFSMSSNLSNFIGIKYLKADTVTYIYPKVKSTQRDLTQLERLTFKSYLIKNHITKLKQIEVNLDNPNELRHHMSQLPENSVILLPPIERGPHINIYKEALNHNNRCLFVEADGDLYELTNAGMTSLKDDHVNLSIKDFIQQTNGYILQSNTALFKEDASSELLDYMLTHLNTFQHLLKNVRPMKKVYPETNHQDAADIEPLAIVNLLAMTPPEQKIYIGALKLLYEHNKLKYTRINNELTVDFDDIRYKDYFSKSGTWLEHYTQRQLEAIDEIQDVNSSVMFVWDKNLSYMINEIDVMALTENQLITISCKDTAKLVESYIYTLESHGDQLAEDAIKIIVSTALPSELIESRANRLGVHIVPYEQDDSIFRKNIKDLIDSYRL